MTQLPFHLLILTPGFPKDEKDSTCLPYVQNFIRSLVRQHSNINVSVISLQYPFSSDPYFWNGAKVLPLGGANQKAIRRLGTWRRAVNQIRELHKSNPIHVMHSLWLKDCAMIGNYISTRLSIKHICTAMGTDVKSKINPYLKLLSLKKTHVIVVSEFHKQQLILSKTISDVSVIPWGIHATKHKTNTPYEKRTIDILGVGSLIPIKDYKTFIDLIKALVLKDSRLIVRIIGEGNLKNNLRDQINKHNLQKNIELLGPMSNHDVQRHMQMSKVLLHTSIFESQGYVFLEALKNGMQIVSRKVGIAQEQPYWFISDSNEDFVKQLLMALEPFEPTSRVTHAVDKTVDSYIHLYYQ